MEKCAHDYVEGWYDKDANRMANGVHDLLAKRHPEPEAPNGIRNIDKSSLMEVIPLYGGVKGNERRLDFKILDSTGTIATAIIKSNEYYDYVHLVYVDSRWQIINALWDFHKESPKKLTDVMINDLEKPIRDYVEGWYDKDVNRVKRGLHSDLAKRSINAENPESIDQYTRSSLLEIVPKYGGADKNKRIVDIKILDVQNDIASAKVISNAFIDYVHLCRIKDEWKIVNVLWSFK